jgi:hypothetical protein
MHFIIILLLAAVGVFIAFSPSASTHSIFEARRPDRDERWIEHSSLPQRTRGIIGLYGRDPHSGP